MTAFDKAWKVVKDDPDAESMACFCGYERGDDAEWQAHISHCPKYKHKMGEE